MAGCRCGAGLAGTRRTCATVALDLVNRHDLPPAQCLSREEQDVLRGKAGAERRGRGARVRDHESRQRAGPVAWMRLPSAPAWQFRQRPRPR